MTPSSCPHCSIPLRPGQQRHAVACATKSEAQRAHYRVHRNYDVPVPRITPPRAVSTKQCTECGRTYAKKSGEHHDRWAQRMGCSRRCSGIARCRAERRAMERIELTHSRQERDHGAAEAQGASGRGAK